MKLTKNEFYQFAARLNRCGCEQKPLQFKWDKMTEFLIDSSLLNEDKFIEECSYELKRGIDIRFIDDYLSIFNNREKKYQNKVALFMEQTRRL